VETTPKQRAVIERYLKLSDSRPSAPRLRKARRTGRPPLPPWQKWSRPARYCASLSDRQRIARRIKIYGSDNPDALRGRGFDMVVLDDMPTCHPRCFLRFRPALAEKNGRTIFIGTVRGRENHLWQTYQAAINDPDWYTDLLPASETGLIPEAELAAARHDMGEDRFASEFECNPDSPIVGSYYGSLMRDADREGRVIPDLEIGSGPIHTAWDLGHGSNMAIFAFQIGDDGLLVHDFIQEDG
jgi:phage terminase large subunit